MTVSARTPRSVAGPLARVLDVDPDLGALLPPAERETAAVHLVAPEQHLPTGPWETFDAARIPGTQGLLVVDGVIAATTEIQGRRHTELLGPGDVLQPWIQMGDEAVMVASMHWHVQSTMTVLLLDRRFALACARWPEVTTAVMNRLVLRARRLSFQMAASSLPRTTDRLLLMLWHFAERWGVVTPDGVVLELPITHSALASVVGTRRPSLTTAIGDLRQSGLLSTREDGGWILTPPAPESFSHLREQVALERPGRSSA